MTTAQGAPSNAWQSFWFTPVPTATLAVVRVAYGFVVVLWAASLAPDLNAFYSSSGLSGPGPRGAARIAATAVYPLLVAGAVCLTLGFHARLAAAIVFLAVLWFQRRNPWVLNAGDRLLANLGLCVMLAPSGAALSVDRWRRHRDAFWESPSRAPWALRLVQIQVTVLYLSTVWDKLQGQTWTDGTAVSYALRIGQLVRLDVPDGLTDSIVLVNVLTWSTLAVELAVALFVWSGRLRPWVLGCGVLLHLCIELTMTVGFLGMATLVAYLAFLPAQTTEKTVMSLRRGSCAAAALVAIRWRPGTRRRGRRPPTRQMPALRLARTSVRNAIVILSGPARRGHRLPKDRSPRYRTTGGGTPTKTGFMNRRPEDVSTTTAISCVPRRRSLPSAFTCSSGIFS